jgi:NADH dehydrogenase
MAGRRLVVLGCGFGGLDVARAVGRSRAARGFWDTLIIDKENFFQFNPLLPAVATGAVETRHIVYPLRDMARHRRLRFHKNKATRIDLDQRVVHLHNGLRQPWDDLVIAVGSVTNHFGVPGAAEHTRPFKTLVDAMHLRARVVELFEMAEQAGSAAQRRHLLSFVVVGGGVTGVEVVAELAEMTRETLLPRYAAVRASDVRITLVETGERLVPMARPDHSAYVRRHLERRGVTVRTGARAVRVEPRAVTLDGGEHVEGSTLVWTAGVHPPDVVRGLPLLHAADGRVRVDDRLRALAPDGTPRQDVHVIGDCAAAMMPDGRFHPPLAQAAVAMGACVGDALVRRAHGREGRPFAFAPTGYIISLGQHSSVVDVGGLRLSGRLAWLLWAGAYLVKMVGLRKQIEVGLDHLTHLVFEHDTSQILARRQVLTDAELDLPLDEPGSGVVN